jgi:hypothetical protein
MLGASVRSFAVHLVLRDWLYARTIASDGIAGPGGAVSAKGWSEGVENQHGETGSLNPACHGRRPSNRAQGRREGSSRTPRTRRAPAFPPARRSPRRPATAPPAPVVADQGRLAQVQPLQELGHEPGLSADREVGVGSHRSAMPAQREGRRPRLSTAIRPWLPRGAGRACTVISVSVAGVALRATEWDLPATRGSRPSCRGTAPCRHGRDLALVRSCRRTR